jgi:hypothetical protein
MKEPEMNETLRAWGRFLIVLTMMASAAARADMTVRMGGTDAEGAQMQANCHLPPYAPPSNTFVGECDLTIAGERLALSGMDVDGRPVLSAVLDGRITIRGVARSAGKRFLPLVTDGAAGFPVYLHIDPFGRAWALERDVPGGGREPVSAGRITEGSVELGLR